jgi:hypothetical protein
VLWNAGSAKDKHTEPVALKEWASNLSRENRLLVVFYPELSRFWMENNDPDQASMPTSLQGSPKEIMVIQIQGESHGSADRKSDQLCYAAIGKGAFRFWNFG